jgi:probable rRNA maturation factor
MAEQIKHTIVARHSRVTPYDRLSIPLIKRSILKALDVQGVELSCEVSVLITDERSVRQLNREFRGIDAATDVLSFPMQELTPLQSLTLDGWETLDSVGTDLGTDPETGLLPLGEIVFSATQVIRQAEEYGRTRDYETAYLTVHSVLHLLGYDHTDEGEDKSKMRDCENAIMQELEFEV